jgi:hypothetical protein
MSRIEVLSKVGADGVLRLAVPLQKSDAGHDVKVTVEPVSQKVMTQEEWQELVMSTAGAWHGELERPPQGEYEEREPLS